jgi:hypothetical protein
MQTGEARDAADIMGPDWVAQQQAVGLALSLLGLQVHQIFAKHSPVPYHPEITLHRVRMCSSLH